MNVGVQKPPKLAILFLLFTVASRSTIVFLLAGDELPWKLDGGSAGEVQG
uniref:Uncharacterized protein n=1 Tax=Arundo donax TaxID=35708 RepID=A0A0A9HAC3_ARUDO